jgi:hypothetical protein
MINLYFIWKVKVSKSLIDFCDITDLHWKEQTYRLQVCLHSNWFLVDIFI